MFYHAHLTEVWNKINENRKNKRIENRYIAETPTHSMSHKTLTRMIKLVTQPTHGKVLIANSYEIIKIKE